MPARSYLPMSKSHTLPHDCSAPATLQLLGLAHRPQRQRALACERPHQSSASSPPVLLVMPQVAGLTGVSSVDDEPLSGQAQHLGGRTTGGIQGTKPSNSRVSHSRRAAEGD